MTNEISKFINNGTIRPTINRDNKRIMVVSCSTYIAVHHGIRNNIYNSSYITS